MENRYIINHIKNLDWILIGCVTMLTFFGLAAIYSYGIAQHDFSDIQKQSVFFVIGFLIMVLISFFDYRILRNNSYAILIFYGICLALLAGLHFFAPDIRGTKGWYKIGSLSLDPIEPTKIALIVLLAKYFSMRHIEMYKFRHIIFSGFYVFLCCYISFY
jgi:rod shape determining protein RodA